jgi:hypothetical protein
MHSCGHSVAVVVLLLLFVVVFVVAAKYEAGLIYKASDF